MATTAMAWSSLPIFLIRVLSPALVFLATTSLFLSRPPPSSNNSPITSVVVATRVPRRALILTLLSLSALSFLLDGLTLVLYAVLDKSWPRSSGIQINAVVGLAAFAGLAALGSWKDIQGVDVWFLKRTKAAIAAALGLDIALVVLLGLSIQRIPNCKTPCQYQIILVLFIQGPSSAVPSTYQVAPSPSLPHFSRPASCPFAYRTPLTSRRLHRCTERWKRRHSFTYSILFSSFARIECPTIHRPFCSCWSVRRC